MNDARKTNSSARFRFYKSLKDFLPTQNQKDQAIKVVFEQNPTAKHLIESIGVPHPEVGQISLNDQPADLSCQIQDGDLIAVYPHPPGEGTPESFDKIPRFVLDVHLGRLAVYLRMLGFDAKYRNDYPDEELAQISAEEQRVLLTRDRRLLMRSIVEYGYCVRNLEPKRQTVEVLERYQLQDQITPFQRCLECNHPLESVEKGEIIDRLEPLTKQYYEEFHRCPHCGQIYWKGSHYKRMMEFVDEFTQAANSSNPSD